ncbi:hypothetical protein ACTWP5_19880, partial [Streptomyces sp. 4N509B]
MNAHDRHDTYTGRLLADRYRLPRAPSEEFELVEARAFDTVVGQEVLVRQVPLPEVVDAEVLDVDGPRPVRHGAVGGRATREPEDPTVRRAVEAALAAARLPDHPRLDQVFDVFVQGDGLWIVSELLTARPLAAVLAEERLKPYRAAEVAADLLAALRIVHAHGWTHRNVTARTVLICDDGRAVLTGLAVGAAQEALCGYDPLPDDEQRARQLGARPAGGWEERHGEGAGGDVRGPGGAGSYGGQPNGPVAYGQASFGPGGASGWPPNSGGSNEPHPRGNRPPSSPPPPSPSPSSPSSPPSSPSAPRVPGPPSGGPVGPYGPVGGADWRVGDAPAAEGRQGEDEPPRAAPAAYGRWDTGAVRRVTDTGPVPIPHQQRGPEHAPEQRQAQGDASWGGQAPDQAPGGPEPTRPGGGAADLVARLRQQGGHQPSEPPEPTEPAGPAAPAGPIEPAPRDAGLPATWDFEGGGQRPALPGPRPVDERAARSGAIAAYRAGTQAGASARRGGQG